MPNWQLKTRIHKKNSKNHKKKLCKVFSYNKKKMAATAGFLEQNCNRFKKTISFCTKFMYEMSKISSNRVILKFY